MLIFQVPARNFRRLSGCRRMHRSPKSFGWPVGFDRVAREKAGNFFVRRIPNWRKKKIRLRLILIIRADKITALLVCLATLAEKNHTHADFEHTRCTTTDCTRQIVTTYASPVAHEKETAERLECVENARGRGPSRLRRSRPLAARAREFRY